MEHFFENAPPVEKKQHFLRNFAKHGLGKRELSSRSAPFFASVPLTGDGSGRWRIGSLMDAGGQFAARRHRLAFHSG